MLLVFWIQITAPTPLCGSGLVPTAWTNAVAVSGVPTEPSILTWGLRVTPLCTFGPTHCALQPEHVLQHLPAIHGFVVTLHFPQLFCCSHVYGL